MFSSGRLMFCGGMANDLFDRTSWSSGATFAAGGVAVPELYRRCLDRAADRWARLIKYNDLLRADMSMSGGWNGLCLEPGHYREFLPSRTFGVSRQTVQAVGPLYLLDGERAPGGPYGGLPPVMAEGRAYTFSLSDPSNAGHPFRFSATEDGIHGGGVAYTSGVTVSGTPGTAGSFVRIVPSAGTPRTLYYYSAAQAGMGGSFEVFASDIIAACYSYRYRPLGGVRFYAQSFGLIVNRQYEATYSEKSWSEVMAHELGHALGVGIFWDPYFQSQGAIPPMDYFLSGVGYPGCLGAYRGVTGDSRYVKVPLENTGSGGTASAHWEDSFRPASAAGSGGLAHPGFSNELMVGYYSPSVNFVISAVTVKALVDMGYEERYPGASEGVPSLVSGAGALGVLGDMVRHRCSVPRPSSGTP